MSDDGYRFRHCVVCDLVRLCKPHGDGWMCELCRGKGPAPSPDLPSEEPGPAHEPDATSGALFGRGELGEHAATDVRVEGIEHETLPESVRRDRDSVLSLSFDSEEERSELVEELGLQVTQRGDGWETTWPVPPDEGGLFPIRPFVDLDRLAS